MDKKIQWNKLDQKSTSTLVIIIIGVLVYLGVSNVEAVKNAVSGFLSVLFPFIAGFVLAYLLNSPMMFLEGTIYKKVPSIRVRRGLALLSAYLLAVGIVAILLMLILPSVVESLMSLVAGIDDGIARLDGFIQVVLEEQNIFGAIWIDKLVDMGLEYYEDVVLIVSGAINDVFPQVVNVGIAIGTGILSVITAIISSIYMLLQKEQLKRQAKAISFALLPQKKANHFLETCRYSNKIFSSFIIGKLIDSAIMGVLCFICCTILGLPVAILLSVIVGVTNIIPFFGPFIGAVPCIMILLIMDPWGAVKFAIMILVLQQFDGNILGPKILGDSTGLSPLMVLVAIIVGGDLFGFAGMLLGVPTFAVIYALFKDWIYQRLETKGLLAEVERISEEAEREEPERSEEPPT